MTLALLALAIGSCGTPSRAQQDTSGSRPVLVLYQCQYWGGGNCSGYPSLALYSDGRLITCRSEGRRYRFATALLSPDSVTTLLKSLGSIEGFFALDDHYTVVPCCDLPLEMLYISHLLRSKRVTVYGRMAPAIGRKSAPELFVQLLETIKSWDLHGQREWRPAEAELQVWRALRDDVPAPDWPASYPSLSSAEVQEHTDDYHFRLDSLAYEDYQGDEAGFGIFRIDGLLWTTYARPIFPGEAAWLEPAFDCH